MENQKVFMLTNKIGNRLYYVCDLDGTLSRNLVDGMIFTSESTASRYQGIVENMLEEQFPFPSCVDIEHVYLKYLVNGVAVIYYG